LVFFPWQNGFAVRTNSKGLALINELRNIIRHAEKEIDPCSRQPSGSASLSPGATTFVKALRSSHDFPMHCGLPWMPRICSDSAGKIPMKSKAQCPDSADPEART
jgi:hypothetical protein